MIAALPLLALALLASPGWAAGPSPSEADAMIAAAELQVAAQLALEEGDDDGAIDLAVQARKLDPGPNTWRARQIELEILERRGRLGQGLALLPDYFSLELPTAQMLWAERIQVRLRRRHGMRSAGIGLLGGAAVSVITGVAFLAHGARLRDQGWDHLATENGGALGAGAVLAGIGAGVGVAGGILWGASAQGPQGVGPQASTFEIGLTVAGRFP